MAEKFKNWGQRGLNDVLTIFVILKICSHGFLLLCLTHNVQSLCVKLVSKLSNQSSSFNLISYVMTIISIIWQWSFNNSYKRSSQSYGTKDVIMHVSIQMGEDGDLQSIFIVTQKPKLSIWMFWLLLRKFTKFFNWRASPIS